jgi:hypothetical protein
VNATLLFGILVVVPMVAVAAMIVVDRRKD